MRVALDNESRVFMSSPIGIAITEETGSIRLVNPSFVTMFGERPCNYHGKNINLVVYLHFTSKQCILSPSYRKYVLPIEN